ncbi:uncharacterized protein BO97DRAFT_428542 [Aspergillus homomorphus CBS 101889]|uniref:Uncharacterized protein n=1 Tax=Aspergillus homomorphus (strain CBS 101889) TaxID=1450537 RepID=A0A395HN13_ASPHC|nr:hypothetical protein BO97DRAFT_428542 [Aspergillus homomorphus CBS 101889]RAL08238.1 hypothetical protein BO97DRAFT_428542 [Aspergillus homomorphus CBS 101889]
MHILTTPTSLLAALATTTTALNTLKPDGKRCIAGYANEYASITSTLADLHLRAALHRRHVRYAGQDIQFKADSINCVCGKDDTVFNAKGYCASYFDCPL